MRRYKHEVTKSRHNDPKSFLSNVSHVLLIPILFPWLTLPQFTFRVAPIPSIGINSSLPECSCAGEVVAGIISGTVSGTSYSWCETVGLPSGVSLRGNSPDFCPTSPPAKSRGRTQTCLDRYEVGARGIIHGHECVRHIGPTLQAPVVKQEYTCPTNPPSK